ncbi:hypothetical protein CDAR_289371 [Caerostris darwini]|uniref:Uncharacterized protein n=1 Tax=Caerostris darwini TaxID=1538125 RepID=A0AAV4PEL1_9ARAC|nr:hypothetical protein CDAR_289371 [Caerostris darwini]
MIYGHQHPAPIVIVGQKQQIVEFVVLLIRHFNQRKQSGDWDAAPDLILIPRHPENLIIMIYGRQHPPESLLWAKSKQIVEFFALLIRHFNQRKQSGDWDTTPDLSNRSRDGRTSIRLLPLKNGRSLRTELTVSFI